MMGITKNKEWICNICGSSSMDSDEKNKTLEEHLKQNHELDIQEYTELIEKYQIGASQLRVKLLNYPNDIILPIIAFISQTWGPTFSLDTYTEQEITGMLESAFEGKALSTVLECISFTFQIDGLSRASSHQLVRVRIGSGFSQKGMSDAYYGDSAYVIPAAIVAAGKADEYKQYIEEAKRLYDDLIGAGVTYQDARFILPHAMTTSLVWTVNFLALKNFCGKRMQRTQSWEMNMLCQLIKKEVATVYPELAKILVPYCDHTAQCNSFGNLFDGCGKYPLNKSHNRYVFLSDQIAHNLKFTCQYNEKCKIHNEKLQPVNNHFLLCARERNKKKQIDHFGKYATQIETILYSFEYKRIIYSKEELYKQIFTLFDDIFSGFEKYENRISNKLPEISLVNNFNEYIFMLILSLINKNERDIKNDIWYLHQKKNLEYNDGWYFDGFRGIVKDLHRKITRLKNIDVLQCSYKVIENTLYDALLYGIFLQVAYEEHFPFCTI